MDFEIKSEYIYFPHNYKLHLLYNSASDRLFAAKERALALRHFLYI